MSDGTFGYQKVPKIAEKSSDGGGGAKAAVTAAFAAPQPVVIGPCRHIPFTVPTGRLDCGERDGGNRLEATSGGVARTGCSTKEYRGMFCMCVPKFALNK